MKYITLIAAAAFVLATGSDSNAQSKTGNNNQNTENRGDNSFSSGTTSTKDRAPENLIEEGEHTNVSQIRDYELEKENGYYQMSGERDWGTNAQLNGFPYPVIMPSLHPDASIDTIGPQIQSGLYDGKGNASGEGAPVRSIIDQEKRARTRPNVPAEEWEREKSPEQATGNQQLL